MIFDNLGLPKDNGASDRQDSARLAGLLAVFDWPQYIPLHVYFREGEKKYVRHPEDRSQKPTRYLPWTRTQTCMGSHTN